MNGPFKNFYRQYLSFSKKDRNVILILSILILLSIVADLVVDLIPSNSKFNNFDYEQLFKELEAPKRNLPAKRKYLFVFDPNYANVEMLDSLDLPAFIVRNILNYRSAGGRFSSPLDIRKIYGMNDSIFDRIKSYIKIEEIKAADNISSINETKIYGFIDPNSADLNRLVEFGFSRFQSNNIVEYRKKGGVFKTKTDLLKIYGIDSIFFELIKGHLQLETSEVEQSTKYNKENVFRVELNIADTTDLMKLAGIGSVYARRILKYRDLLGGFYSTTQLCEVYNFSEETYRNIETSIFVDTLMLKKIRINFAEYSDLLKHPYLNKKQIEAILNYRDQNGAYKNVHQLKVNGLVDSETFERIRPYLTCR